MVYERVLVGELIYDDIMKTSIVNVRIYVHINI